MSTTKRELLNTQMNAEETPKENSSKLIEREDIPETPFVLISIEQGKYFAVLGMKQITPNFKTKGEVLQYIEQNMWNIVLTMILIINETRKDLVNKIESNQKQQQQ